MWTYRRARVPIRQTSRIEVARAFGRARSVVVDMVLPSLPSVQDISVQECTEWQTGGQDSWKIRPVVLFRAHRGRRGGVAGAGEVGSEGVEEAGAAGLSGVDRLQAELRLD